VAVGYSDHTPGIEVPIAAVALGATVIEKHFTLDRSLEGPDHLASLEPDELAHMVRAIRNIELALGDGVKQPTPSEQKNITVARKSIHLARPLVAGQVLTEADLVMKRPGSGISPMLLDLVTGRPLAVDVVADHLLRWEDLT
jgi:N,N'-diacetyllegionaminate synthase